MIQLCCLLLVCSCYLSDFIQYIDGCARCMQLQFSCERHLSHLSTMHEYGDSLSKCLSLIAELKDFEKLSKVSFAALCCLYFVQYCVHRLHFIL